MIQKTIRSARRNTSQAQDFYVAVAGPSVAATSFPSNTSVAATSFSSNASSVFQDTGYVDTPATATSMESRGKGKGVLERATDKLSAASKSMAPTAPTRRSSRLVTSKAAVRKVDVNNDDSDHTSIDEYKPSGQESEEAEESEEEDSADEDNNFASTSNGLTAAVSSAVVLRNTTAPRRPRASRGPHHQPLPIRRPAEQNLASRDDDDSTIITEAAQGTSREGSQEKEEGPTFVIPPVSERPPGSERWTLGDWKQYTESHVQPRRRTRAEGHWNEWVSYRTLSDRILAKLYTS